MMDKARRSKDLKSVFSVKKVHAKLAGSIVFIAIVSIVYTYAFMSLLEIGETVGFGFKGILQSDTILFRNIFQNSDIFMYLNANVKNVVVPSLLWMLFDGNWYMASIFNVGLLSFTAMFLYKIANHLGISIKNKILVLLVLLPETFIYTVGVLKEIPTLFIFTALCYYFLKKRWILFILYLILLVLFRYQFAIAIMLFLLGNIVFKRKNIRFLVLIFVFLSSLYPLLSKHVTALGSDAALLYRELGPGLGVGSVVESIQSEWYGLSTLATMVRLFQMIVEPWPALNIFEGSEVNIMALLYSISACILFPVWYKYFRFLFYAVRYPNCLKRDESVILCMSFVFVMMVGLNSFVHHRYLYPGLGLIILVAYIPIASRLKARLQSDQFTVEHSKV